MTQLPMRQWVAGKCKDRREQRQVHTNHPTYGVCLKGCSHRLIPIYGVCLKKSSYRLDPPTYGVCLKGCSHRLTPTYGVCLKKSSYRLDPPPMVCVWRDVHTDSPPPMVCAWRKVLTDLTPHLWCVSEGMFTQTHPHLWCVPEEKFLQTWPPTYGVRLKKSSCRITPQLWCTYVWRNFHTDSHDADWLIQDIACKVVSSSRGYTVHMISKHCTLLLSQQYVHWKKKWKQIKNT